MDTNSVLTLADTAQMQATTRVVMEAAICFKFAAYIGLVLGVAKFTRSAIVETLEVIFDAFMSSETRAKWAAKRAANLQAIKVLRDNEQESE